MEGYARIVVVRKGWLDHAIFVVAGLQGHTSPIKDKQCVGVNTSACFLTERFWERKSIRSLVPLALLVLDYARIEYPTTVGNGFELFYVTTEGISDPETYDENDAIINSLRSNFEDQVKKVLSSGIARSCMDKSQAGP
jgi:hypothetical protein